jgi:hypothetical protein
MATISGCRHLKVNLKAKIYIYVNSTTQRCPNKIIKIFLLEGFFHLPPVSLTPVANLELRISLRIFEKIRNGPNGIIRGSNGKTLIVHYRTLSFFAFRFFRKRKFAFFRDFKYKIPIEPVRFASKIIIFLANVFASLQK